MTIFVSLVNGHKKIVELTKYTTLHQYLPKKLRSAGMNISSKA